MRLNILTVVLGLVSATPVSADWPAFRGPSNSGVTKDAANLPVEWNIANGLRWKTPLPGPGVSSPIVVGSKVFVTCYTGYGERPDKVGSMEELKRHLVCVDAEDGSVLWDRVVDAVTPEDPYSGVGVTSHGYASHTPASDGQRVYVFFGKSGVLAFDLEGKQLWQTAVGTGSDPWEWGSASSPIVSDGIVIVTASAESQAILGLDAASGEIVWRQEAGSLDGTWSTPLLVTTGDRTDAVFAVPGEVWGVNPMTGGLRWYCEINESEHMTSSAAVEGDVVFVVSNRGGNTAAVKVGGEDDVTQTNLLWKENVTGSFASPVAADGLLFIVASDIITALDTKTGERVARKRLGAGSGEEEAAAAGDREEGGGRRGGGPRPDYPSPVIADRKLYYLSGDGEFHVYSADRELKLLAVNQLTDEEESFGGTPAVADGRIYARSDRNLYCVSQAAPRTAD